MHHIRHWGKSIVHVHPESLRSCLQSSEWLFIEPRHPSEFACDSRIGSATLPGAPKVLSGAPPCSETYHNHSHGTHESVIRVPSYSQGRLECPPRVCYSPQIDASKYTLHILSDTPGGSQGPKYILLMYTEISALGIMVVGVLVMKLRDGGQDHICMLSCFCHLYFFSLDFGLIQIASAWDFFTCNRSLIFPVYGIRQ